MTLATDKQSSFNEIIDDYGETFTLRHFTGVNAPDDTFDDVYDEVDITKTNDRYYTYKDYTIKGMIQPITLSQREHRLKHTVIGYYEQGKMQLFMKTKDTGGDDIKSRFNSPDDYNLDLNDQIIHDGVTYIVNYIEPWEVNDTVIYFKLILKIDIDEV